MKHSPFLRCLLAPCVLAVLWSSPALAGEGQWSQGKGLHCRLVPSVKANGVIVNVVTCGKFGV